MTTNEQTRREQQAPVSYLRAKTRRPSPYDAGGVLPNLWQLIRPDWRARGTQRYSLID